MTADGYTNLKPIGTGGFATVYRAKQVKFNRLVAMKVLNLGAEGTVDREAFHTECVTMGALSTHPNIVTIYDSGFTDDGLPFISMELCDGTLLDRIKKESRLNPVEVAEIGSAVANALGKAHEDGILHSDIKPQNIFFTEYGVPSLGDFGIASVDSSRFGQGVAGISLHYSAPELFEGDDPTPSTDLYALGSTLYTALAGRRPFAKSSADSRDQTMSRVAKDAPPRITEQAVPQQLNDLVFRLLEKDPMNRPRSASSVAATLSRIARDIALAQKALESETKDPDLTVPRPTSTIPRADEIRPEPTPIGDDDPTRLSDRLRAHDTAPPDSPLPSESNKTIPTQALAFGALLLSLVVAFFVLSQSGDEAADPRLVDPGEPPTTTTLDSEIVPLIRLEAPENLTVTVEGTVATVTWSEVEGAEGYRVQDSRVMETPVETSELETMIELDPEWPRFCPDITAFSGSTFGETLLATGSNCVSAADG